MKLLQSRFVLLPHDPLVMMLQQPSLKVVEILQLQTSFSFQRNSALKKYTGYIANSHQLRRVLFLLLRELYIFAKKCQYLYLKNDDCHLKYAYVIDAKKNDIAKLESLGFLFIW